MEALGIGSSVRKLTVENLAEALVTATTDQRQIDRAKLVGEQIRSVGTLSQAEGAGTNYHRAGKWCRYRY